MPSISSAFRSCGQRCSALRVLFLQAEIADSMIEMIAGAMRELVIGDPADPRTDIGPVIDAEQLALLVRHRAWLEKHARIIHECALPHGLDGHYFAPVAAEIDSIGDLAHENFGPILHVIRYDKRELDAVIDAINATGYGLTMGLHTRLDGRVEHVARRARVGNLYVNRNIIGAVVGSQPFGGEGLSGTGPKAGGPNYLLRFCAERTVTINTAAAGGNVELLAWNVNAAAAWVPTSEAAGGALAVADRRSAARGSAALLARGPRGELARALRTALRQDAESEDEARCARWPLGRRAGGHSTEPRGARSSERSRRASRDAAR